MKKFAYILIGCFTALIVTVAFIACNNKKKGDLSGVAGSLVGTWMWTTETEGSTQTWKLTINADMKGVMVITLLFGEPISTPFTWSSTSANTVCVFMDNNNGGTRRMDFEIEWDGPNRMYLALTDGSFTYGPFTRVASAGYGYYDDDYYGGYYGGGYYGGGYYDGGYYGGGYYGGGYYDGGYYDGGYYGGGYYDGGYYGGGYYDGGYYDGGYYDGGYYGGGYYGGGYYGGLFGY